MDFPRLLWMWPLVTLTGKSKKNRTKRNPYLLDSRLLVLFPRQLEILVTALNLKPEKRTSRAEAPCMGYYSEYVLHSRAFPITSLNNINHYHLWKASYASWAYIPCYYYFLLLLLMSFLFLFFAPLVSFLSTKHGVLSGDNFFSQLWSYFPK